MIRVRATHRRHEEGNCDESRRRGSEHMTSTARGGLFPHHARLRSALVLARLPPKRGIYPSHAGCAAQQDACPEVALLDPHRRR